MGLQFKFVCGNILEGIFAHGHQRSDDNVKILMELGPNIVGTFAYQAKRLPALSYARFEPIRIHQNDD